MLCVKGCGNHQTSTSYWHDRPSLLRVLMQMVGVWTAKYSGFRAWPSVCFKRLGLNCACAPIHRARRHAAERSQRNGTFTCASFGLDNTPAPAVCVLPPPALSSKLALSQDSWFIFVTLLILLLPHLAVATFYIPWHVLLSLLFPVESCVPFTSWDLPRMLASTWHHHTRLRHRPSRVM